MERAADGFLGTVRAVGISGSLKQTSANSALLRAIAEQTEDLEVWDGVGALAHFSPDRDGGEPVRSLRDAVADHELVVIATPEYAGGMPGVLKNALDWLVGTGELYDKAVVVVSAAPSEERGANARRWVEEVARMQGARVAASFTVATRSGADPRDLTSNARRAWARIGNAIRAQAAS